MNINNDYDHPFFRNPSEEMDRIQSIIYNMLIKPNLKKLNLEEAETLSEVGSALQIIAKKATAYECLSQKDSYQYYRN